MPNVCNDIKLDFKDVLLRPKRSKIQSRADVDLVRQFKFQNSKQTHEGTLRAFWRTLKKNKRTIDYELRGFP